MIKDFDRKIVLEDGSQYYGYGFGDDCDKVSEIVFNTSMVGYQEILSDPSNTNTMVVMTYPLIGNYGMTDEDDEAKTPTIDGLVVREYNDQPSNFRYTKTLSEVMAEYHIPGIAGIDTRKLTRSIRDTGTKRVLMTSASTPVEEALEIIKNTPVPTDGVARVSCKKRWYSRTASAKYTVVVIDCGVKNGIIRELNARGCNVTVVPHNIDAATLTRMNPDGVLVSNGPGNPEDAAEVIELVRELKGKFPMFGIGLGNLILSLAYGAKTYKLKCGHRGGAAVKSLADGKVISTYQNHSYAVDAESLCGTGLVITHQNVMDGTVAGIECVEDNVFAVQFQPESAPGPQDSAFLFDKFIDRMKK